MSFLASTVFGVVGVVSAPPAFADCSGSACNYTDPAAGCSDTGSTPYVAELTNGGYDVATVNLRYSSSCRTTWSLLSDFTNSTAPSYAHPWVNRVGGGPDTYYYGAAGCSLDPTYPSQSRVWSYQIDDAGYSAYAWGGIVSLSDYCGYPTGSLGSYINTYSY